MIIDQTEALTRVSRPSRYLGGELGSLCKPDDQVDIRMALAFPDVYEVGMSHLGLPILYHSLNRSERIAAERVYAPWTDMEEWLTDNQQPLCSLESSRPLADFDLVGFTLQYELSYTNILVMLQLAGIPLRRAQRDATAPLIVVGGPCAFNPEPLADFIDVAVIGDAEEAVVELAEITRQAKREGWSRQSLLERLVECEGFYVPQFFRVDYRADGCLEKIVPLRKDYSRVKRRFLADLDNAPYPTHPIVPFMQTVHNRVALEIARGCTRGCRFCQAGYIYRPVRERSPETIRRLLAESLAHSGFEEISLLSLSTGDYSCIEPLLQQLMQGYAHDQVAVSLPSLRVGSLTPELMEEIKKVRKTGFTLAPEAGSDRLRKLINKGISTTELLTTTASAYSHGWRLIKLYFMLGLPTETAADLEELIDLAARVKQSGKGTGGNDVNVAVSTFVPKPHTPFQWEPQLGIAATRERHGQLREGLQRKKLRFKYQDVEMSFLEGVFARGDRRLSAVLERAVALGCRFDGWREHFDFGKWQQAFEDCGMTAEWYLRRRQETEVLPWDHIDCGLPKQFFLNERAKAYAGLATADCRNGDCQNCGVCDFDQLKMRLVQNQTIAPPARPASTAEPAASEAGQQLTRVRLRLRKQGRARMVGHLEYIKMFQRAIRRCGLPMRFSQGYHPMPKISYLEALPLGVASDAELVDLELVQPLAVKQIISDLNAQLPEGFEIIEGEILPWKSPSPSVAVTASHYRVPLPDRVAGNLPQRIERTLSADHLLVEKQRKGRLRQINLRPDIISLALEEGALLLELKKGSPLQIAALLLDMEVEDVRRLEVRKTGIEVQAPANIAWRPAS